MVSSGFEGQWKANKSFHKLKVRLVAKDYTHRGVADNVNTLSPVLRICSIHLMLAIVTHRSIIVSMDLKTVVSKKKLEEDFYMET